MMTLATSPFRPAPLRVLVVALAVAAPLLLVSGCSSEAAMAPPARPVLVMTVPGGAAAAVGERSVPGVVVARYATDIGFQVGGRVGKRLVEVGQVVRKGQVLMQLDDSDYALALAARKVEADQATADEQRLKTLVAEGAVSVADTDRQKARAEAARAQYEIASNQARYATLVAPYDGVVTELRAEAGQMVAAGVPVVSMARQGELEIAADIPEALVAEVARRQARAEIWGAAAEHYRLKLRELSPAASQPLRTYRARFALPGLTPAAKARLRLGMTAQVQFSGGGAGALPGAVTLPASALVKASAASAVWVLPAKTDHLTLLPVHVLAYDNDTVAVEGVAPGMRVVTTGVQKLDAGLRVRAVERSGAGLDYRAGKGA